MYLFEPKAPSFPKPNQIVFFAFCLNLNKPHWHQCQNMMCELIVTELYFESLTKYSLKLKDTDECAKFDMLRLRTCCYHTHKKHIWTFFFLYLYLYICIRFFFFFFRKLNMNRRIDNLSQQNPPSNLTYCFKLCCLFAMKKKKNERKKKKTFIASEIWLSIWI